MLIRKANQNKEKLAQYFKTWPKTNGKISFLLGKKSPKSEKYINFKPHLIHYTAQVTAKMRCGAIMIFANSKLHRTTPHRICNHKNEMWCNYGFA